MTIKKESLGRPRATDRESVARAVAAVGFEELTFAEVAEQLDIGIATLHRYTRDRDDLVRLGIEHVLAAWDWPPLTGAWRDLLMAWGHAAWQAWAAYPGAAREAAAGIVPAAMLNRTIDLAHCLVERGFDPADSLLAVDLVFGLAADSRRAIEARPEQGVVREATELLESRAELLITRAIAEVAERDPQEWFTRKLNVLLDGIAAQQSHHDPTEDQEGTRK